jgi:hypothetical protein
LDRYLVLTCVDAQQTADLVDPNRPTNLWDPIDGGNGQDFGAHGEFDDRSSDRSVQVVLSTHRNAVVCAGAATLAAVTAATLRGGPPRQRHQ